MITAFVPENPVGVVPQAVEFVRGLIVSGELPPGMKLPPTHDLAAAWRLPVGSVHAALAVLSRDGLLMRQPGRGTFVCRERPALTAVALYTRADALTNPESGFSRMVLTELHRQLTEDGIQSHIVIDPRSDADSAAPLEPFTRLFREHRVGATILACSTRKIRPWMNSPAHFTAFGSEERFAGSVILDLDGFLEICLGGLAAAGCRAVGLVHGLILSAQSEYDLQDARAPARFVESFCRCAVDKGLRVRPEWIFPRDVPDIASGQFQLYGHAWFKELWSLRQRPDGLVVFPDSFVPGILLAMAEFGLRATHPFRLAYHRNVQHPILNPYPSIEALVSERDVAAALIRQARRSRTARKTEPIFVKYSQGSTG